MKQYTKPKKS